MKLSTVRVGDTVLVSRRTLNNPAGSIGVCVETYQLDGRPGASFLFPNGAYDGFSERDTELFGVRPLDHEASVADYTFISAPRLFADFRAGRFAAVWSARRQLDRLVHHSARPTVDPSDAWAAVDRGLLAGVPDAGSRDNIRALIAFARATEAR